MKRIRFMRVVLTLCMLWPFLANGQMKFTPTMLSIGDNLSPQEGYVNISGLNGLNWRYLTHFFKIDLTGNAPAFAGTNDRIDIADVGYGKPMYLPFYCASVFSTMTNDFMEGIPISGLSTVAKLQPYSYRTDEESIEQECESLLIGDAFNQDEMMSVTIDSERVNVTTNEITILPYVEIDENTQLNVKIK